MVNTFRLFWVADDKQSRLDSGRAYASRAAALAAIPRITADLRRQWGTNQRFGAALLVVETPPKR